MQFSNAFSIDNIFTVLLEVILIEIKEDIFLNILSIFISSVNFNVILLNPISVNFICFEFFEFEINLLL